MATKHFWLYALRLKENKYYIGTTSRQDPHARIAEHMNGFYTAQWVKKYPYVSTAEVIELGDITPSIAERLELQRTLQYMKKYGMQNVRGGKLTYSGKYLKLGSRFITGKDAEIIFTIVLLMAGLTGLGIMILAT